MSDEILEEDLQLKHPFSLICSGVSGAGKTFWILNLIKHCDDVINPKIEKIIISYSQKQDIYDEMAKSDKRVILQEGLEFDLQKEINTLLIVDDQMNSGITDSTIQELFTRGRHHRNLSIIFITQNLLPQGKHSRDIRLNSNYLVIFKSPTFSSQVKYLDRQLFSEHKNFLSDSYLKATVLPYSYLFVTLRPDCKDQIRVRSCIFPDEHSEIYLPCTGGIRNRQ